MPTRNIAKLPTFDRGSKVVNVVIEASRGSRIKLKYDEADIFRVRKVLPLGLIFPFDFGFLPSTAGGDGDPLDAFVFSESGLPCCSVVLAKVVGVLLSEQTEKGQTTRNDRLITIPLNADSRRPMQPSITLDSELKTTITQFLVKYNELQSKKFRVLGSYGAKRAMVVIQKAIQAAAKNSG